MGDNAVKKGLFFFAITLLLNTFTAGSVPGGSAMQGDSLTSVNNIRQDIEILASDSLMGRATATPYEKKAAVYIAQRMKDLGAEPLKGQSYIQTFKLDKITIDPESRASFFSADKGIDSLKLNSNFLFLKNYMNGKMDNTLDVVNAGYGISEDDYKNLDAKEKVVLVLLDLPPGLKDNNIPDVKDRWAVMDYQIASAQRHGALGIIFIADSFRTNRWEFAITYFPKVPEFRFPQTPLQEFFAAMVRPEAFKKFMKPSLKNLKVKFNYSIRVEPAESYNVIGVLQGKDPVLKNEFVVAGAHHDHEGIIEGKIYNGADDNSSGVAALLEAGRIIMKLNNNKRSVLLISHGSEEGGMLGSKYFVSHTDAIQSISAMINFDMIGRESRDTIYSVGSGKLGPELKNLLEETNRKTVNFSFNYRFDDPFDPEKLYYRSDHYSYAKKGIPSVFLYDHMIKDYHKDTDDIDKIDYRKIAKAVKLGTNLILKISNLDHKVKVTSR